MSFASFNVILREHMIRIVERLRLKEIADDILRENSGKPKRF